MIEIDRDKRETLATSPLRVFIGAGHHLVRVALTGLLEREGFVVASAARDADVAICDGVSPRSANLAPPVAVPTLVLVAGSTIRCEEALAMGYRGCLGPHSTPQQLTRALRAVANGELWVKRRMATRLIDRPDTPRLTRREREVLHLLMGGMTNREIAERLCISVSTVKAHMTSLLWKRGAKNRLELVMKVRADERSAEEL